MFTFVSSLKQEFNSRVNIVSSEYSQLDAKPESTVRGFQTWQKESIVQHGSLSVLQISNDIFHLY